MSYLPGKLHTVGATKNANTTLNVNTEELEKKNNVLFNEEFGEMNKTVSYNPMLFQKIPTTTRVHQTINQPLKPRYTKPQSRTTSWQTKHQIKLLYLHLTGSVYCMGKNGKNLQLPRVS